MSCRVGSVEWLEDTREQRGRRGVKERKENGQRGGERRVKE